MTTQDEINQHLVKHSEKTGADLELLLLALEFTSCFFNDPVFSGLEYETQYIEYKKRYRPGNVGIMMKERPFGITFDFRPLGVCIFFGRPVHSGNVPWYVPKQAHHRYLRLGLEPAQVGEQCQEILKVVRAAAGKC